jgi:hypothetical protein
MVRNAVRVSLVVGTILNIFHHPGIFDSERQSLSRAHLTSTLGALALHQERPHPYHAPRLSLMHSVILPALARGHHTPSLGICVMADTKRKTYGPRIPTTASSNPERPAFHTAPDHASHGMDAAKSRLIRITVAALARPARPALAMRAAGADSAAMDLGLPQCASCLRAVRRRGRGRRGT